MSTHDEHKQIRPAIYPDTVVETRWASACRGGSTGWTQADIEKYAACTPAEHVSGMIQAAGGEEYLRWLLEFLDRPAEVRGMDEPGTA
jgi:hypothetical protein